MTFTIDKMLGCFPFPAGKGCGRPSGAPSVPAAPGALTLTVITAAVRLEWDANPGGEGVLTYSIYRRTTSVALSLKASGLTQLFYEDSTVSNGVTYYYAVTAVNVIGEGPSSSETSKTPTLPGNVAGFTATNLGVTTIDLYWDTDAGVTWEVEWQLAGGDWSSLVGSESPIVNHSYQVQSLIGSTAYDIRVRSTNAFGDSAWQELTNVYTIGAAEVTEVTCIADVAGSLHDRYFLIEDAAGSVSVQFNCGARKQKVELDFAGLSGSGFVTAGAGLYLILDDGSATTCFWFDTGTEISPPATADTFVQVSIDASDSSSQLAGKFLTAATGSGFNDAGSAGNGVKLENQLAQIAGNPDAGTSGVWVSVAVQGRSNAVDPGTALRNILVAIVDDDTSDAVAAALESAINTDAAWSAVASANVVTITDVFWGPRVDAADVNTVFSIAIITQGA